MTRRRRAAVRARAIQVRHWLAYLTDPGYAGNYVGSCIVAELDDDRRTLDVLLPLDELRARRTLVR